MNLTFLSGYAPLTKTIRKLPNGKLEKDGYPNIEKLTSLDVPVSTIKEFYDALIAHGTKGACLLKGILEHPLKNESRRGLMPSNTPTRWVCFDLDHAPFSSPEEFMRAIKLDDISYVVQYSASYRLDPKVKTLSAHIFILLNKTVTPNQLAAWFTTLNLDTPTLEHAITLSTSNNFLHHPLDVVVGRNNTLIYTSAPNLIGLTDPFPKDRIQLCPKPLSTLPVERMIFKHMDELKKRARIKLNELQVKAGITPNKKKEKIVGERTVQLGCVAASSWEQFEEEEWFRYNLNGGDSKAYWHPKNNWQYLRSFKGEADQLMSEVLPEVYKDFEAKVRKELQAPNEDGELILAFREKRTARYWKGIWNKSKAYLEIYPVDALVKLDHYLQSKGSALGPFVPEYELIFDPSLATIVDTDAKRVNRFIPTPLMSPTKVGRYPIIQRIIDHAVGKGEVQEQFLNWLACIVQLRTKTQVAWVLHGTQGTGKGLIINHIMKPILQDYAEQILAPALNEKFNGWREHKLLIMVDEIEVDLFSDPSVEAKLRNWVTEPTQDIRVMGTDLYKNPCFNNWLFGSNKPQPVRIPKQDRRYNIAQYQPERFKTSRKEIEQELPKEIAAFAHYLCTRKADLDMAGSIFDSVDRRQIQELSVTSIEELASDLIEGNLSKLHQYLPDEKVLNEITNPTASLYRDIIAQFTNELFSKITRDQLGIIFKHCIGSVSEGTNKFTSFLRHYGIHTKKIRIGHVYHMGIEVMWNVTGPQREELLKTFDNTTKLRRIK